MEISYEDTSRLRDAYDATRRALSVLDKLHARDLDVAHRKAYRKATSEITGAEYALAAVIANVDSTAYDL